MEEPDESDEYCPHCDNHFLREAVTKGAVVGAAATGETDLRQEKRFVFREVSDLELYEMIDLMVVE
jgi:hypothetical protein